jgi:DNA helicase II / ATP-dependent DNA helicase PcrA
MFGRVDAERLTGATDRLLDGLNDAQRAAVVSEAAPLCILAGAGSGKTRVLTRRIAHRVLTGSADAPHVLALTFTRKAAGEMRGRLGELGVRGGVVSGTFHAVAYSQLRRRWADRGEREPVLLKSKLSLIARLIGPTGGPAVQPQDVAAEIEWAKARLVPPAQYEVEAVRAGRTPPLPAAVMAGVYARYEAEKVKRGVVDFDDLLSQCAVALDTDTDFATGQRWRFRHLFVDEFQDVNPVQFRLLKGWLGDRADLCVVGDPNQAIYSWNGADPRLLDSFPRLFPGSEVVRLDDNYRSSPQILSVANAVLADGGSSFNPHLRANRPNGPIPSVRSYDSDVAEARGIAARLRRAHRPGSSWSTLAVLTRTNAQCLRLEEALRAAQIPYRVRDKGAFLDQPEVRSALAELRRAPASVPFADRVHDLEEMVTDEAGAEERRLSLEGLLRLAREFVTLDPRGSMEAFDGWLLATIKGDEPDSGGDAVEIATFHRAKGLEWPVVFVAGVEKGLVPIGHASDSAEAEAEERRLLYVALTRAQSELHVSWAQRRSFGAKTVHRSPSPWLAVIEASCRALEAGGPDVDWRLFLAEGKAKVRSRNGGQRPNLRLLDGAGEPDPEMFAALKAWRSTVAKAAAVPAYVIFHDTTLAAVASARPSDRDALLAVPGLGPVKAERYGDDLLRLVADHGRSA